MILTLDRRHREGTTRHVPTVMIHHLHYLSYMNYTQCLTLTPARCLFLQGEGQYLNKAIDHIFIMIHIDGSVPIMSECRTGTILDATICKKKHFFYFHYWVKNQKTFPRCVLNQNTCFPTVHIRRSVSSLCSSSEETFPHRIHNPNVSLSRSLPKGKWFSSKYLVTAYWRTCNSYFYLKYHVPKAIC